MSDYQSKEYPEAIRAVRLASRLCRAVAAEIAPDVLGKADRSPVTVADFGSQALICRAIAEAFPDDPIIAEEDAAGLREPGNRAILEQVVRQVRAVLPGESVTAEDICRWIDLGGAGGTHDRFWTLDPIDGTKGFLRGEQYAVALALVVEGQVVVAALACPNLAMSSDRDGEPRAEGPIRGVVFSSVRGMGALASPLDEAADRDGNPDLLPVEVSPIGDVEAARYCESVESGHSAHGDAAEVAAALGIAGTPLRMDSQAKYAVVARGEAEIYLRMPTRADYREKIWDHAAGVLIVEEAGGAVSDIAGKPLEFHHGRELSANRGVVVTNGRFHGRVLGALGKLGLDNS